MFCKDELLQGCKLNKSSPRVNLCYGSACKTTREKKNDYQQKLTIIAFSCFIVSIVSSTASFLHCTDTLSCFINLSNCLFFFYQRVYEEDVSKDETNEEKEKAPEPEKVSCIILNVIALRGFIPFTPQH